jgi:chemotaxis protein CheD
MNGLQTNYINAGSVFVPGRASAIRTVVTFGVVVTVFHAKKRKGGLAHFIFPKRSTQGDSNALYCAPALVTLIKSFKDLGPVSELEVHLIGGAHYRGAQNVIRKCASENIEVAKEVLALLGVRHYEQDLGGKRARRMMFNTFTGELAVARVDQVRREDWAFIPGQAITR